MGGKRLTPQQIEDASEVFARTNNASEAARAIGVSVQTLTDAFKRLKIVRNRNLHTQACERGLRKAREQADGIAALLARALKYDTTDASLETVGLEPGDLAKLVQAFNGTVAQRVAVADREDRRKQGALTRQKTRAEIELLRKKISGEHVDRIEVSTDDALDARINALLGRTEPESPDAGGAGGTPDAPGGAGAPPDPTRGDAE